MNYLPVAVMRVKARSGWPIASANTRASELLGYGSPEELLGLTLEDLCEVPAAWPLLRKALVAPQGGGRAEISLRRKDAGLVQVSVRAGTLSAGHRILALVEESHSREKGEEALSESKEMYRQIFATETDAITIFDAETHAVIDANDSALRLYGYTRSEYLALTNWDLTAELEKTRQSLEQTLTGELERVPLRYHKKKDGILFPVEISASTFLLNGRRVFCGVVRDISERVHAEEALRKSEELYHQLFATESDAITIIDAGPVGAPVDVGSFTTVDVNDNALRLYGYTREEYLTLGYQDLSSEPEKSRQGLERLATGGRMCALIRYHRKKDGTVFPVEIVASTFTVRGQRMICNVTRDISERVMAEKALRKSEEMYHKLFATEPDAILIYDAESGKFIEANDSAVRLFGYTLSEFLTLSYLDITAEKEKSEQTAAQLQAGHFMQVSLRYYRKKDGTEFPVEITASTFILEGRRVFCGVVRDITDRVQAEQVLRESEEKYRQLFTMEAHAVGIKDAETGYTIEANAAMLRMLGYTLEELRETPYEKLTAEPAASAASDRKLLATGGIHIPIRYVQRKDGTVFPVETSATTFLLGGRRVICGVSHDITARVRAQEEVMLYQKRLQSLALELSLAEERERKRLAVELHDGLVQVLAVVKMRLAFLGQLGEARLAEECLAEIKRLVDRANRDAQSLMRRLSPPALYEMGLAAAAEWLTNDIEELYGLKVTLDGFGNPDPLDQRTRIVLFQCLRELLVNAAKHAKVDNVAAQIVRTDQAVVVTVKDTGVGFEPGASRAKDGATGYGLFSIGERLRMLGGSAEIRSVPGQGTTVILEVPLEPTDFQAGQEGVR